MSEQTELYTRLSLYGKAQNTTFSKNLKFFLQPIEKYYVTGAFFANWHTSVCGVPPPGIEE